MTGVRLAIAPLLVLAALLAAWRVVALGMADGLAARFPQDALAWDSRNAQARLMLAQQQFKDGQPADAAATARALLRIEPLQAEALATLARATEAEGDAAGARALYALAARRAPRDQYTRAWLVGTQLQEADYPAALANANVLMTIAPPRREVLIPILVQFAAQPAFATELARVLADKPDWRGAFLDKLRESGNHDALDQVYGALQDDGALSAAEAGQWYDWLIHSGLWGEAYSRWVSGLHLAPGATLPLVYAGDFESAPTGTGFDWHVEGAPGVGIERVAVAGATGDHAARVSFLGRRSPDIHFEQDLLLAPGAYRLRFRAKARDLLSDVGLEWAVSCLGPAGDLGASARLKGSFEWKDVEAGFTVPDEDCPAQRLWLRNPGSARAGKIVSGTMWFDDFVIDRVDDSAGARASG